MLPENTTIMLKKNVESRQNVTVFGTIIGCFYLHVIKIQAIHNANITGFHTLAVKYFFPSNSFTLFYDYSLKMTLILSLDDCE